MRVPHFMPSHAMHNQLRQHLPPIEQTQRVILNAL